MAQYTPGFVITIRAHGSLGAVVQFFDPAGLPFNFGGYGAFYGSVKQNLTDLTPLFTLSVDVSDEDQNGAPVLPADGWLVVFASSTDTAPIQAITEGLPAKRVRGYIDIFGDDPTGARVPIAHGFADLLASVTEFA